MSNHLRFAQDNVPADEPEKKGRINGCCGNQGNGQACHRGTRPARGERYRADRIEEVPEPEYDVTDKENTKPGSSRDSRQASRASARPQSSRDSRQASRASTAQSYGDSDVSSDDDVTENQAYITEGKLSRSAKKPRQLHIVSVSAPDDDTGAMLTDSDSEDGDSRTRGSEEMMEYGTSHGDIYNDSGWDTDLEIEEDDQGYDGTGRAIYLEACRNAGVVPASYFLRHMFDTCLDMKHHGLGPCGTKPISVALVSNTSVVNLDLTDNWLGVGGGTHICEMLKENCYITHLDLSENKLDEQFASRFIDVLSTNNTLTHINLTGNDLDDRAAKHLAEAIMNTTRLESLNLSRNRLGEKSGLLLGPAISENSSIKHLDLSWNSIRRKGAVEVAKGIKQNVLMQSINLSWNGVGNDGAKALGDALKANAALEELNVSNNRISAEGSVLLGKGVAVNESLKVLKMSQNPMQSAGCYAICAAISKNQNSLMEELDFTDITVNSDFVEILNKVREELPNLKVRQGSEGAPRKPKARVHPFVKLRNYIEKHNLRLVDFFNKFDKDHSMSVTREEFAQGIEESGIKLTDEEITMLLDELDKDGDGEINYSELVIGHQDFTEKEKKMAVTILDLKT